MFIDESMVFIVNSIKVASYCYRWVFSHFSSLSRIKTDVNHINPIKH